jgi:pimeloyl-ACP methyl ester carboxylesterase
MSVVHVNGIDLYHERGGSGPRLLFLNGSGATLEHLAPILGTFRARFDLLAHDQRGLGRTQVPDGPYSMADYARDALALLDEVGWDSCRVIGVSFGGMVAQELAVTAPERVERLALLCTSPGGAGHASYPLHELDELDEDQRMDTYLPVLDTRFDAAWLAEHPNDRAFVEMMAAGRRLPKSDEQRRGEREQLQARRGHDVVDRLGRITCPVLVSCGRFDGIAPPANSEEIARRVPDAQLRRYDGGHVFFLQDDRVLRDAMDFLSADDNGPASGPEAPVS